MTHLAPVLGVTIDGYAVEGGYDTDGGPATTFGVAQSLGRIRASTRSSGTFEHLEELARTAADLGFREMRLTTEWARLEPRHDERDDDVMAHYTRVLEAAAGAAMRCVVVLCDVALPSWMGAEPWLTAWAPRRFASHAGWVASRLGEVADTFVTFRAPNAAAVEGWRDGVRPPFRSRAADDATSALDGMLLGHQLATDAIAEAAPAARRAVLFEARAAYDDDGWWRDVAAGVVDPVVLGARRDEWRRTTGGRPLRMRQRPIGSRDAPRSTPRWRDVAPFEWWLGASDAALLATALGSAAGAVTTVELGAGERGWADQLTTGLSLLAASAQPPSTVHLHGLVSSTGPLKAPVGLLALDQHGGTWATSDPGGRVGGLLRAVGDERS